jgi:hypothetical protein
MQRLLMSSYVRRHLAGAILEPENGFKVDAVSRRVT